MPSYNKVVLIGHLGRDPEIRYLPNGTSIASFSMATNDSYKDGDEWKEKTEWHRIVAFGKVAERIGEYLKKGDAALVEGKLQTRKWQDKDGTERYVTEVNAFLCNKLGGIETPTDTNQPLPKPAVKKAAPTKPSPAKPAPTPTRDDDLPF